MDFIEQIRNLSARIESQKTRIQTEEATKTALVMPFISLLGYDVSDLNDVVPEYTADFGTKQGEKVDYAIFKDDNLIMIMECKKFGTDLTDAHISPLTAPPLFFSRPCQNCYIDQWHSVSILHRF